MTDDPGVGGANDPTSFVVAANGFAPGSTFVASASNATPTAITSLATICPASGLLVVTGSGESAAKSSFAGNAFIGVAYSIARNSSATDNTNVVQSSALAIFNGDANRDFLHVQRVDAAPRGGPHLSLTAYATTPQTSIVNGSFVWNGRLTASAGPASSSLAAGTTFVASASNASPTVITTLPTPCAGLRPAGGHRVRRVGRALELRRQRVHRAWPTASPATAPPPTTATWCSRPPWRCSTAMPIATS